MKVPLILLALLLGGAGAAVVTARLLRPDPPPVPAIPANVEDPAIRSLLDEKRAGVVAEPRSADARGEYGEALDAHALPGAADCYRAAAEFAPGDPRWPVLLAARLRETDPAAARQLLEQACRLTMPTPAHLAAARLMLAELEDDAGHAAEAEALTRAALEADPGNAHARFRTGAALVAGGDAAGVPLLLSLARNPAGQKKSASAVAAYYRRAGDIPRAEGFGYAASLLPADNSWADPFAAEVAASQRGSRSMINLESRQSGAGDFAGALATARRLADQYPSAATQLILGRALVQSGDPASAVPVLTDSAAADPKLAAAHAFLGVAEFQLAGRVAPPEAKPIYTRAIAAFDRAIALKSDYAPAYYYRAQALAKLGRGAEALAAIGEFLARRPEEWEGHLVQAELLEGAGRKPEAVAAAERAVKLANPAEPRAKAALAKLKAGA